MALTDFFRINLPYGIRSNKAGEWTAFNREYQPLGYNTVIRNKTNDNLFVFTKYKRLTRATLVKLAWSERGIMTNQKGEITAIFFYADENVPTLDNKYFKPYFDKIKLLSKLQIESC